MSKIRIRHGENEIELEGSDGFVRNHLEQFYQKVSLGAISTTPKIKKEVLEPVVKSSSAKKPTPAEFNKSKRKISAFKQVAPEINPLNSHQSNFISMV